MSQSALTKAVENLRLPSLPTVAVELLELIQQKNVQLGQIVQCISCDPALSARLLKMVNSSFYGLSHRISTIGHAAVVLGLDTVKTLALGFALAPTFAHAGGKGFDHVGFWRRSLFSAVSARQLAREMKIAQSEEAFLAGLLKDVGLLALSQALGAEFEKAAAATGGCQRKLAEACRAGLGVDPDEIGGHLAQTWNLPPVLAIPIRFHDRQDFDGVPADLQPLARCVTLGGSAADVLMDSHDDPAVEIYLRRALEWFNLMPQRAHDLLGMIYSETVGVARLLDLPTGAWSDPSELLAHAHEVLESFTLLQSREAQRLTTQAAKFQQQAQTDALTGLANRGYLDAFLSQACREAQGPLSLFMLDADHFKKFNDHHGHATGDRALQVLACALRKITPEHGLAARYGGEEFALILPRTPSAAALRLAQQTRLLIERVRFRAQGGQELSITVSIGVATTASVADPTQLLREADQALYAAKAAGRNCVRLFNPAETAVAARA